MKHDEIISRFETKSLSTRQSKDDATGITLNYATFTGYASVFDYQDDQRDVVKRGAFTKSIARQSSVKMLWQHNPHDLIGKYTNLKEDTKGLYVEGEICLNTEKGLEAFALMKQGALDSLSIGYKTKDFDIDTKGVRSLKELDLYEISPVTFPSNDRAMIDGVKSLVNIRSEFKDITIKEFERKLREVFNCSQSEAKAIASQGFKAVGHRDGDEEKVTTFTPWDSLLSSFQPNN